jgi:hypothetical protein
VALASKGPGGAACRLSDWQLDRLRAALEGGPALIDAFLAQTGLTLQPEPP